ncbi:MAG: response regulator [bacterium]
MKRIARILLIDDKPWWSEFFKKMLSTHGYKLDIAHNEDEALKKLDSQKYGLVFLDFYVSGPDGTVSLRRILEKHPEERVVVVSASPSWKEGRDIFRIGAIDYLSKSFDESKLLKTIQEGLKIKPSLAHK